jgi:triacylglycerol esterase/lipase EstA (alpha/beta hydrolase family)
MNLSKISLPAVLACSAAFASTGCEPAQEEPTVVEQNFNLNVPAMRTPQYWGDLFLKLYASKLVVGELEAGPPPLAEPRTVLLITGVTIPGKWFDPIVARLERDGFRPVVYVPPDLLSGSLFQASQDLAAVVEKVRLDSGQDKIDILAECTGGLIARHYIQSLGGDAKVSRLVTFVSPQHGIAKAPLAAAIAGWPALYDLSPGSAFLQAVNSKSMPASVPFTSIYSCTDEYIRPYQTSIVPGATNIGLCDRFVDHFQTFYDPSIYLLMHDALIK